MLDTDALARALTLYIQIGNMSRVLQQLKKETYIISRSTLDKEKKRAAGTEGDWVALRAKYISEMAYSRAIQESFGDKHLADLITICEQHKRKLREDPDKLNSQEIYALAGLARQINDFMRVKEGQADSFEAVRDEFYEFVFGNAIIKKALEPHMEYMLQQIDKFIRKAQKKKGKRKGKK